MTRHARNCTAGAVYTYHEKKKDNKACGYGTLQSRIGKDSVKDFDCCCLTLQPCRYPVITPDGYLYDKEAILEYIIHQKKEIARRTKEYEKDQKKEADRLTELAKAEEESRAQKFMETEKSIVTKPIASTSSSDDSTSSISNVTNGREKVLPSFWIPALTPAADKIKMKKPDKTVLCPMSGKPIKAKDLIPIQFTEVKDPDEKKALIARKVRYMCAVTHDVLSNSLPTAVLRTSGNVVTMECVEKLIRKDMIDPTNGKALKEEDIILLQRGGTGYASTNEKLDAKVKKPVMMA
ncbi:nitric oxide synthase-interacting protein homolog [Parasteatoda tepidariorum]|uniref:nitric oxide synthase-interacting protein homolog n=1 Tax=Parasteatoda tepidariorum TaxID=114398 RepID=UPI00077F9648|nr:nitric oxide synthase-interacting protein homolog [Parasteatoda tepidariorum]